jgi:uncharacterized protein YqgC (DUF456 family)
VPQWLEVIIVILAQILLLVGLFGLVIPIFPGVIVMWLVTLGYGVVTGFRTLGIVLFVLITLLMLFSTVVDNLLMGAGARKGGASWLSILVALVAGVAGTLIFPPFGGLIAAPLAVFAVELIRFREWRRALTATGGMATGWGLTFVARFLIGVLIMMLWWLWVWKG